MFDSMFVSIHAPRAGGDLIVGAMRIGFRVSIHAPRAGGDAALVHRCGFPDVKGKSLATLIAVWAPPVENNTSTYLRNVCRWTGLTPDTIIDDYLGLP